MPVLKAPFPPPRPHTKIVIERTESPTLSAEVLRRLEFPKRMPALVGPGEVRHLDAAGKIIHHRPTPLNHHCNE